jgi:adenine-specific DNA-methyltransferase
MTNAPNNAKKEKFIGLLHELFQLNQPELDFGLYRIMHAKSEQIRAFIAEDLTRDIDEALASGGEDKLAELKAAYEQARAQAVEFGIPDPDNNPKVMEAKAAYEAARDNGDDPSEIYDHLFRFFSRYYDKGDFLSRRYHVAENDSRAAPYAVPYDGREVYLHWANKDQYYIKSTETLSNFSFDLTEALHKEARRQGRAGLDLGLPQGQTLKVRLRLVDAAEGAHNNVKENQSRFFILHTEQPIELLPSPSGRGAGGEGQELIINFEYRPDPEKTGQEGTWQKKRLEEAEAGILGALKGLPEGRPFLDGLGSKSPTEKQQERTLLAKYLAQYTARNTMDYFIHKDLGGFLRRELDFYIKNEVMRLDDVDETNAEGVTRSLKKIAALRKIGRQIIAFLAQLEDFQKKLWLKKKFVTEVNYCITLDRVPEKFYAEIAANDRQREEWDRLFAVSDLEGYCEPLTEQFLTTNSYLVLDTGLFDARFRECLLSEIEGLDEQCDGLLVCAENMGVLRALSPRFDKSVKTVYIDPPYNTGSDDFLYKDGLKRSSWLTSVHNRISACRGLLNLEGSTYLSIDDVEQAYLKAALDSVFGYDNFIANIIWKKNFSPRNTAKFYSENHDYVLCYANDISKFQIGLLPRSDEAKARYSNPDKDPNGPWTSGDLTARNYYSEGTYEVTGPTGKKFRPSIGNYWRVSKESFSKLNEDGRIWWGESGENMPRLKRYLNDVKDGVTPITIWDCKEVGHTQEAKRDLTSVIAFSSSGEVFNTVKPVRLLKRIMATSGLMRNELILDFFAGSGSIGHAVISLNREDGGRRKYILVEMGDHFDAILKPRIQKVLYSKDWKDGKPLSRDGISHCFKYLRLESYEDTLNNLVLDSEAHRAAELAKDDNRDLRREYLLHYFLDVETRGSASLLNVTKFRDPTAYTLRVMRPGGDEQVPVNVDLVETFNWLIGLEVALLDRPRTYRADFERETDPELPEDQHTRLVVKGRLKESEDGPYWFRVVEGTVRRNPGRDESRDKVLVVWRKLTDDPEQDAAVLEALLARYKINQADSEFDAIYINGSHGLSLTGSAKTRLLSLEETFMARMWAGTDGGEQH